MPDTTSSGAITLGAKTAAGTAPVESMGQSRVATGRATTAGVAVSTARGTGTVALRRVLLKCVGRGAITLSPVRTKLARNLHMKRWFPGLSWASRQRRFSKIGK